MVCQVFSRSIVLSCGKVISPNYPWKEQPHMLTVSNRGWRGRSRRLRVCFKIDVVDLSHSHAITPAQHDFIAGSMPNEEWIIMKKAIQLPDPTCQQKFPWQLHQGPLNLDVNSASSKHDPLIAMCHWRKCWLKSTRMVHLSSCPALMSFEFKTCGC